MMDDRTKKDAKLMLWVFMIIADLVICATVYKKSIDKESTQKRQMERETETEEGWGSWESEAAHSLGLAPPLL